MKTPHSTIVSIIAHVTAGNGVRQTARLLGINSGTVMRWTRLVGEGCERLLARLLRDLRVRRLELDELHASVHTRQRRLHDGSAPEHGDAWTFIALDVVSRAIVTYAIGKRHLGTTQAFIRELRRRVLGRPAITTDGYPAYLTAIARWFGDEVDLAQVVKEYESARNTRGLFAADRYVSAKRTPIFGNPDVWNSSTSHVERLNGTVRARLSKFSRRTPKHAKDLRHLQTDFALFVATYNFVDVHVATKQTPAQVLGITDRAWSLPVLIDAALAELAFESTDVSPQSPMPQVEEGEQPKEPDRANAEEASQRAPNPELNSMSAQMIESIEPPLSRDPSYLVAGDQESTSPEKQFTRQFPDASIAAWRCAADAADLKLATWIERTIRAARPLAIYRPRSRNAKIKWLGVHLPASLLDSSRFAASIAGVSVTTWVRCQLDLAAFQQLLPTDQSVLDTDSLPAQDTAPGATRIVGRR